jgi:predicted GNAT superfamily acetyltransferase
VQKRPTAAVGGAFVADGDELHATLDPQNFARYQPLVAVIRKLNMQQLGAVYIHYYPLFQQSYLDLGYPNGYFNDRLVQVIDVLLATPQPVGPVVLVRPNVMYTFVDPVLEARPAGQKLLIRMGPENAAAIKAKLVELRAVITAAPLKR